MKTFLGILAGFLFPPSILGLMALWVSTMMRFNVSKADFAIGFTVSLAVFLTAVAVAVKYAVR